MELNVYRKDEQYSIAIWAREGGMIMGIEGFTEYAKEDREKIQ
jgi:hypothetical protein